MPAEAPTSSSGTKVQNRRQSTSPRSMMARIAAATIAGSRSAATTTDRSDRPLNEVVIERVDIED